MQVVPIIHPQRVITGALRVGADWPGVFIRGDEAMAFAVSLKAMKIKDNCVVDNLIALLDSCKT